MAAADPCSDCHRNRGLPPSCWRCCDDEFLRRSTRRLGRRRSYPDGGDDYISALPDDLLLQVLVRLRCVRLAVRTSLLARRWRGLWTRLPDLTFHGITPCQLHAALTDAAALSQVCRRNLALLDVWVPYPHKNVADRISSMLRAAERLAPAKLSVGMNGFNGDSDGPIDVELPCFRRANAISLDINRLDLTLPPAAAGHFPALESLKLSLTNCGADFLGDLLRRCPRLRTLEITDSWLDSVTVHSSSVESLVIEAKGMARLDIMAPVLKKLRFADLNAFELSDPTVSFSAPMLEELSWQRVTFPAGPDKVWSLVWLHLEWSKNIAHRQLMLTNKCKKVLSLKIEACHVILENNLGIDDDWSIGQAIAQLPVTNFSDLELHLSTEGHVYGAIVMHLLGNCTFIQGVKIYLEDQFKMAHASGVNCPCDQPSNWRDQTISLTRLKEVEIQGFKGDAHEIDWLKLLFRCATMLERITVKFINKSSPSECRCTKIQSILKTYPSVKCYIYHSFGSHCQF